MLGAYIVRFERCCEQYAKWGEADPPASGNADCFGLRKSPRIGAGISEDILRICKGAIYDDIQKRKLLEMLL